MFTVQLYLRSSRQEVVVTLPPDTWVLLLPAEISEDRIAASTVSVKPVDENRRGLRKFKPNAGGPLYEVSCYPAYGFKIRAVRLAGAKPGLCVAVCHEGEWVGGMVLSSSKLEKAKAEKKQKKVAYERRKHFRRDTLFDRLTRDDDIV